MAREKKQKPQPPRKTNLPCPFCKNDLTPNYVEYKELGRYLSDRAKILGRARTGVCARHQRHLSTSIKRARFLGLLPYTPSNAS
jgi:small subunit ribosomal protein S18